MPKVKAYRKSRPEKEPVEVEISRVPCVGEAIHFGDPMLASPAWWRVVAVAHEVGSRTAARVWIEPLKKPFKLGDVEIT